MYRLPGQQLRRVRMRPRPPVAPPQPAPPAEPPRQGLRIVEGRPGTKDDPQKQLAELIRYGELVAENINNVRPRLRRQRQADALAKIRQAIDELLAGWD